MVGALFNVMAGLQMQHVPYRGEALALGDLIAGRTQVVFGSIPASIEHIRAGQLRALAITTKTRAKALPHLPSIGDFVPGYEASTWYGIAAPRNTPIEIVQLLNREINAGLNGGVLRARLTDLDGMPIGGSPAEFRRLIAEDTQKWGQVIRAAKMKPD
jgi:tripartite-type tricarboxylate transporter receptor subunit TctC